MIKKNLWVFGDSYSCEFTPNDYNNKFDYRTLYVNYKGYIPKVYGQIISEELNLGYNNLSQQGGSNDGIFQSICEAEDKINDEDILIINWSSPNRFRIASKHDKWVNIVPSFSIDPTLVEHISDSTINEMIINRNSKLFINDVNSKLKIIKRAFKNNLIIDWTPFNNGFQSELLSEGFETINMETNGEVNDGHYNENAHVKLSQHFREIILKMY